MNPTPHSKEKQKIISTHIPESADKNRHRGADERAAR